MRFGVLADDQNNFFQPMDHTAHERHLGLPHIVKHKRNTRKRKQGYRSTPRPRAPYMTHWELAQLLNVENPREALPAFEVHRLASQMPKPPASFRMLVEQFKEDNPSFVSSHHDKLLLPESAYFLQKSGLDVNNYFLTKHGNLSKSIAKPLHIIYEKAVAKEDQSRQAELEAAYEESMRLLLSEVKPEPPLDPAPYSPFKP